MDYDILSDAEDDIMPFCKCNQDLSPFNINARSFQANMTTLLSRQMLQSL
jgi:hypothetical protein